MADFESWILDFPSRVGDVYDKSRGIAAKDLDRRVTRLIMALYPTVLIACERLDLFAKVDKPTHKRHKSGDAVEFSDLREKFLSLKQTRLAEWLEVPETCDQIKWLSEQPASDHVRPWESWEHKATCGGSCFVPEFVETVRHALAHGNLWTVPDDNQQIRGLLAGNFTVCSKPEEQKCSLVFMTLDRWEQVFCKWRQFLSHYKTEVTKDQRLRPAFGIDGEAA
ncbi:MAG: hypothetical protein IBJ10_00310 [Phycisphaerales bacterium]|nr:hypothetical protein [Phycisphaerales bacterium]